MSNPPAMLDAKAHPPVGGLGCEDGHYKTIYLTYIILKCVNGHMATVPWAQRACAGVAMFKI